MSGFICSNKLTDDRKKLFKAKKENFKTLDKMNMVDFYVFTSFQLQRKL